MDGQMDGQMDKTVTIRASLACASRANEL